MEAIREAHIRQYIIDLQSRGKYTFCTVGGEKSHPQNRRDYQLPISNITINNYLRNLKAFFTWAMEMEYVVKSPMKRTRIRAYELDFCRRVAALPAHTTRNAHVNRAKAWIAAHLHEPMSAAEVAAYTGITGGHLSELFRQHEGLAIQAYIRRERLRQAEHLLRFSDMSISEIATSLAFSSQSHFCAAFRKETRLSPKQYRDQFARSRNS